MVHTSGHPDSRAPGKVKYTEAHYEVYGKTWNDPNFKQKVISKVGRQPDWGYERGYDKFGYRVKTKKEAKELTEKYGNGSINLETGEITV